MTAELTESGYLQTQQKLAALQKRLSDVLLRNDLSTTHRDEVARSYREMIGQYLREIKLYEAKHPPRRDSTPSSH